MKKTKIQNILSYIFNFILIGFILLSNKGFILNNDKITLKNMSESTQVSDLNKSINELEASHEEYQNYIQIKKIELATALTNAGVTTSGNDTFETITTNVSKILTNKTNDATANANEILTGKTAYVKGIKITGTMEDKGAWTSTPTSSEKVTIPEGYHNGSGYVDTSSVYTNGYNTGTENNNVLPIYNALTNKGFTPQSSSITDIVNCINSIKATVSGGGIGGWSNAGSTTLTLTSKGSKSWTSSNNGIRFTLSLSN